MLSEFSGIPLPALMKMAWLRNGTGIDEKGIQLLIDTAAKYNFISRRFLVSDIIDPDVLNIK